MAPLRGATPTNRTAGADIHRALLRKVRSRANAATLALKLVNGAAKPAVVLEKAVEVHRAYHDIDELCLELAGAVILSGYTAEQVHAATGISTATLTRHVPRAMTALRGKHLVRDDAAPHGWREQQ